ncbi:hypothetical protein EON67_00910 [archaeon]|nr:MAG: hypothetical protein EON67_00910 [archaeon]
MLLWGRCLYPLSDAKGYSYTPARTRTHALRAGQSSTNAFTAAPFSTLLLMDMRRVWRVFESSSLRAGVAGDVLRRRRGMCLLSNCAALPPQRSARATTQPLRVAGATRSYGSRAAPEDDAPCGDFVPPHLSLPCSFFSCFPGSVDFSAAPGRNARNFPLLLLPNFLSDKSGEALAAEADALLRRRRYEKDHWDSVIVGYREERQLLTRMSPLAQDIAACVHALFPLPKRQRPMPFAHMLDLSATGHIGHHVDSVKFSGDIVAGISLLSDRIMELQEDDTGLSPAYIAQRNARRPPRAEGVPPSKIRILLPKNSFYMLMCVRRRTPRAHVHAHRYSFAHVSLPAVSLSLPLLVQRRVTV